MQSFRSQADGLNAAFSELINQAVALIASRVEADGGCFSFQSAQSHGLSVHYPGLIGLGLILQSLELREGDVVIKSVVTLDGDVFRPFPIKEFPLPELFRIIGFMASLADKDSAPLPAAEPPGELRDFSVLLEERVLFTVTVEAASAKQAAALAVEEHRMENSEICEGNAPAAVVSVDPI